MLLLFLLYETQIETFEKFKEFKAAAENKTGMRIKALDPTEEVNTCLMNSRKKHEIRAETTAAYSELQKYQIGP